MTPDIDVTVAAVTARHSKFLIVEENSAGRLVFNQPAGHLEPGETLLEAVARETLEESAYRFTPTAVLGCYVWRHPVTDITCLRIAFRGTVSAQLDGRALDDGIVATHWLTREELQRQSGRLRSPMVMRCVDDYLAGMAYPLDILTHWDLRAQLDIAAQL